MQKPRIENRTAMTDPSPESPALTPEQDEMRLRGLRILARIIARQFLDEAAACGAGSGIVTVPASDTQIDTDGEESSE